MAMNSPETNVDQLLASRVEIDAELRDRKTDVAVLFTDVVGSTAFFERFGDTAGLKMVHSHADLAKNAILEFKGRVIKTIGDSVMAAFSDVEGPLAAAAEMQRRLLRRNYTLADKDRVQMRIGINWGTAKDEGSDVYGDTVNTAARICKLAGPAQILISSSTYEGASKETRATLSAVSKVTLKGKSGEEQVYEVIWTERSVYDKLRTRLTEEVLRSEGKTRVTLQLIGTGQRWSFDKETFMIGRDPVCELVLESDRYPTVSRMHARLRVTGGQCEISDLKTANGTMVNGQRITTAILHNGDAIRLGADGPALIVSGLPAAPAADAAGLPAVTQVLGHEAAAGAAPAHVNAPAATQVIAAAKPPAASAPAQATVPAPMPPKAAQPAGPPASVSPTARAEPAPPRPLEPPRRAAEGTIVMKSPIVGPHGGSPPADLSPSQVEETARSLPAAARKPEGTPRQKGAEMPVQDYMESVATEASEQAATPEYVDARLSPIRFLLIASMIVNIVLMVVVLYQINQTQAQVAQLHSYADDAMKSVTPQLDERLGKFESRLDQEDQKMSAASKQAQEDFIRRMNVELPNMMDRYVQQRMVPQIEQQLKGLPPAIK
jgi:adenylate cyclase